MLVTKTVSGMKDILPKEEVLKQYLLKELRETYSSFGFVEIETPCIEHLSNLTSDQGWDNEKLIYRILKRGDKIAKALEDKNYEELCDEALRYDLTVPLCRYYAQHRNELPQPFKAMQIGFVFRADRPQKGRYRSFLQCDIDELGDPSNIAEIDILLATATYLQKIRFDQYGFKFLINDRRILKACQKYANFKEEDFEKVCIVLDKYDKIGFDGVKKELMVLGYEESNIDKYINLIKQNDGTVESLKKISSVIEENLDKEVVESLITIIETVSKLKNVELVFDPTLVRGMGYYTGPIFEIKSDKLDSSFGGGGRYDKMINDFTGIMVPATGLSLGFERLITILMEQNYEIPNQNIKIAFLFKKDISKEDKVKAFEEALKLRREGKIVYIAPLNKNKKFQLDTLEKDGFTEFREF